MTANDDVDQVMRYRSICEICSSHSKKILLSRDYLHASVWNFLESYYKHRVDAEVLRGSKYEIAKCQECGFVWQSFILSDKWMEKLYSEWISSEESLDKKKLADVLFYAGYAKEAYVISKLLKKKPHQIKILDYGMGWGYWSLMAQAFGYEVCGLELSQQRRNFAQFRGINVIHSCNDITDQFDFINCEQVLEHIPEPLKNLEVLVRMLKSQGIIKISVPDGKNVEKELSNPDWVARKNAIHPLEHINCFTHKSLQRLTETTFLSPISRPLVTGFECNPITFARSIAAKFYLRYFGTTIYFRKK